MKTIAIGYKISGTKIILPFKAVCSVTQKEFTGDVIIEYRPKNLVLEFCDAELQINKITKKLITAEELAHLIFMEVVRYIKPEYLKVIVDVKYSEAHRPVQVWVETGNI